MSKPNAFCPDCQPGWPCKAHGLDQEANPRSRADIKRKAIDLLPIAHTLEAMAEFFDLAGEVTAARLLRSMPLKLQYTAAKVLRIDRKPLTPERRST